jgi:phosphate transport system permease protein
MVQALLGTNAFLAILTLLLISLFILREALGFFPEYESALHAYRESGVRLVEEMQVEVDRVGKLCRLLEEYQLKQGSATSPTLLLLSNRLREGHFELIDRLVEEQAQTRWFLTQWSLEEDLPGKQATLWREEAVKGFIDHLEAVKRGLPLDASMTGEDANVAKEWIQIQQWLEEEGSEIERRLQAVSPGSEAPFAESVRVFFLGHRWISNSANHDWFGLLPLLSGTLLVAFIAVSVAVPLAIASAIYVNQFASRWERVVLKPSIEFIAAFPTVLLGFIGVLFWGPFLQAFSELPVFRWLPGLPISDRLNALTAGSLLALVALPVIFTLVEDALEQVRREYAEASLAVGASRVQTLFSVILPVASPGMLSALLLGFARISGETMIVLLVAGNRIQIPEFSGIDIAFFEPVHTMTGIIAQEMGEVSFGSLHYRALFLVSAVLFLSCLGLNHLAKRVTRPLRRRVRMESLG